MTINRPPEEVFAYLTDVRNLPEWQSSVSEARLVSEGPVGVGSAFVEKRSFLGRTLENRLEVTEYAPGAHFDLQVVSGPVQYRVTHRLQPSHGGTRIDVAVEGETKGFFKVADALVARQGSKQLRQDFARLKEILEARS